MIKQFEARFPGLILTLALSILGLALLHFLIADPLLLLLLSIVCSFAAGIIGAAIGHRRRRRR